MIGAPPVEERTLPELRADLALLDRAMQQLAADYEAARAAEDDFTEGLARLGQQIGELSAPYNARLTDTGETIVVSAPVAIPPDVTRRIQALGEQRREHRAARERWLRDNSIAAYDSVGMMVPKVLTTGDVKRRQRFLRLARDRAAALVAQAEALAAPATIAPEADASSQRRSLRQRFGVG